MNVMALFNAMPGAVSQGLIWGIMAIGVYITYKILDMADLTVDGTMCTGGAVFVVLTMGGAPVPVAMLGALCAGLLAGLVTGVLHTFCGIPAILSGILTQLALYSVNLRILGGANLGINVDKYPLLVSLRYLKEVGKGTLPFYYYPIFVLALFLLVIIVLLYYFFGTERGCSLRATGSNLNMARAQGINTNRNKILGLMLSNGLVAISSALLTQYNGFADVNMGRGAIVIGLAAVIIGEVLFAKVFRNFALRLVGVGIGGILYYLVYQIVMWLGLKTDDMKLITAIIVGLFLSVPYWRVKFGYWLKTRRSSQTLDAGAGGAGHA